MVKQSKGGPKQQTVCFLYDNIKNLKWNSLGI